MKNLAFLTLLIIPGLTGAFLSGYWGYADFLRLTAAERNFQQLVAAKANQRELFIAAHRENIHRLNVAAEGVWIGLGLITVGVGMLGIIQRD
ncbi:MULTISPECIES: hypothetical protein [unclassified Chamaesiphon]|uniref:hypothetical protein n=1 Tax=unclassified Chamaesiphon TaxID=2620921 RepID=UPI00286C5DE3|nr:MULTISPECIES: hypothetical protein [unclassified Chamaesiphon]